MSSAAIAGTRSGKTPAWDDGYPIAPSRRAGAAAVMFASTFIVMLDMTAANVAVPHIAGNLGASLEQGTWVITSYAIAEAIAVPLTGWLAGRVGAVRLHMLGMAGFTFFSVLCGLSVTLPMLVGFRIAQGLCGGLLLTLSQILFYRIFPPRQLAKVMAYGMLVMSAAPAIGPIVGGTIADLVSWHWIFLINLPIGFTAVVASRILLPPAETMRIRAPVDAVGLALLFVSVGALQLMLDTGRDRDWFADSWILILALIAAIGCCLFVVWELTDDHPIVNLRLLRHRPFSMCVFGSSIAYCTYFSSIVMVPQWLQSVMGYSAIQAGMVTATSGVAAIVAAQYAVRLMLRIDPRIVATVGGLWAGSCVLLRTIWSTDFDMFHLGLTFGLQGLGMSVMAMPLNNMALNSLEMEDTPAGASLLNFFRTISAAMGAAVALTFWSNEAAVSREAMVPALHPGEATSRLGDLGISAAGQAAYIGSLVDRQAMTIGMLHTFAAVGLATLITALLIWTIPPVDLKRLKGSPEDRR